MYTSNNIEFSDMDLIIIENSNNISYKDNFTNKKITRTNNITEENNSISPSSNNTNISKYEEYYSKSLIERIENHYFLTKDHQELSYNKIENRKLNIQGPEYKTVDMLELNKIKYLAIINVDINHSSDKSKMNLEEIENTRATIIEICGKNNFVLATTPSDSFHIYCNTDDEWIKFAKKISSKDDVCRTTKISIKNELDIVIFTAMDIYENESSKINNIFAIQPKTKYNEKIKEFQFVIGSYANIINYSIVDVLKKFHWLEIVQKVEVNNNFIKIYNEHRILRNKNNLTVYEQVELSDEVQEMLINGLKNIEIHNCSYEDKKIEEELSLIPLFQAINCLNENLIEKAYYQIFTHCKLTENARINFNNIKEQNIGICSTLNILLKIVNIYNNNYYKNSVLPLIAGVQVNNFDINDDFGIIQFKENAKRGKYKKLTIAANDLLRIYRYHTQGQKHFIEKNVDISSYFNSINFVNKSDVKSELSQIRLFSDKIEINRKIKIKTFNAWDAFIEYSEKFHYDKLVFNSNINNPSTISYFHGYKYKILQEYNEGIIHDYLKLVYEVISDSDENVYNYILNWISYIAQNPGKRNMTSIVLKGIQGAGKNTFINIISELFYGYSAKNVTDMEDVIGSYNKTIENKILIVLNEVRSPKGSYIQNMDCLKSIITDPTFIIGEKFEPRREIENVSNLVFISNHSKPLIISPNDRRFLVLNVNGKYAKSSFLKDFHHKTEDFYNNLLTFFINRDIKDYDPDDIPMTQAKKDIIEACRSKVEDWIVEHYNELAVGITLDVIISLYNNDHPSENTFEYRGKTIRGNIVDWKKFQLDLKDKCINGGRYGQKNKNGKVVYVYKLKNEYLNTYKPGEMDEN